MAGRRCRRVVQKRSQILHQQGIDQRASISPRWCLGDDQRTPIMPIYRILLHAAVADSSRAGCADLTLWQQVKEEQQRWNRPVCCADAAAVWRCIFFVPLRRERNHETCGNGENHKNKNKTQRYFVDSILQISLMTRKFRKSTGNIIFTILKY